jgi:GTPase involved in cell partitioning and DNA repair
MENYWDMKFLGSVHLIIVLIFLAGCEAKLAQSDIEEVKSLKKEISTLRNEIAKQNSTQVVNNADSKEAGKIALAAPTYNSENDRLLAGIINNKGWRYVDILQLSEESFRVTFISRDQRKSSVKEIPIPRDEISKFSNSGSYRADLLFFLNQDDRAAERDFIVNLFRLFSNKN